MTYFTLRDIVRIPFIGQTDEVSSDRTEVKISLDGCEGVELDSTVLPKNLLITAGEILNFKPRM